MTGKTGPFDGKSAPLPASGRPPSPARPAAPDQGVSTLEQFQFETLRVANHTACRFAEKTRFSRSLRAGRRCAAASHFIFFKVETLYMVSSVSPSIMAWVRRACRAAMRRYCHHQMEFFRT